MLARRFENNATNHVGQSNPEAWIAQGWSMARHEDHGVFPSIEMKFQAETREYLVHLAEIEARGHVTLEKRDRLQDELTADGFNQGAYLKAVAEGRIDLWWAVGFGIVNAVLAGFVLAAFGPIWTAFLLALLAFGSSAATEEFFRAYEDRDVLRQTTFIVVGVLALVAQFYLGSTRGMFLAAITPEAPGKASDFFRHAGPILQYGLGVLAAVSEFLCGYKIHRAQVQLCSAPVRATQEHARCNATLIALHRNLEHVKAEPGIRKHYRTVGARQYLASKETRQRFHDSRHFSRALVAAIVTLLVIVFLLFSVPNLLAASPTNHANLVLLDLSKSVPKASYDANIAAVPRVIESLGVRDRIVVLGIGDSFGTTKVLFDETLPADAGFMGLYLQAAREQALAGWKSVAMQLSRKPRYDKTDILGALRYLAHLGLPLSSKTRIYIFSDLRQSSRQLDLEHVAVVRVDSALAQVNKLHAVAPLQEASVYLLGVDAAGTTDRYFATLKEFWLSYFKAAGAKVKTYTVSRTIPEL